MGFIAVYITHQSKAEAERISKILIDRKLVACANIFPIDSQYQWQGQVQQEGEWVSLVKTKSALWEKLIPIVEELHPYEVPCIAKIEMEANSAYEQYINESTLP